MDPTSPRELLKITDKGNTTVKDLTTQFQGHVQVTTLVCDILFGLGKAIFLIASNPTGSSQG